ncbi:MAG: alpha/beta hydrolase [Litorimonas sp.]
MTRPFRDHRYTSTDGLSLFAKLYDGDPDRPALFCMHGLTRNADDFDGLLERLPEWRAVSVDQRGRARSDWDADGETYTPEIYCRDMLTLIDELDLDRPIAVGTSMGGLMTLMMSAMRPGLFEAAIINDIGPDVDPVGLFRLRAYVGQAMTFESWDAAAAAIRAQGPDIFPDFAPDDWMAFARRVCAERDDGRVAFRYDPAIADGLKATDPSAVPPDLWPLYTGPEHLPMLILRGETSDILSAETAARMQTERKDAKLVTVPGRGHAPTLTEPVAVDAITTFLETWA